MTARRPMKSRGALLLRSWKAQTGMTLKGMAELFGLPSGACHVAHLLAGRCMPSLRVAVSIDVATSHFVSPRDWLERDQ